MDSEKPQFMGVGPLGDFVDKHDKKGDLSNADGPPKITLCNFVIKPCCLLKCQKFDVSLV